MATHFANTRFAVTSNSTTTVNSVINAATSGTVNSVTNLQASWGTDETITLVWTAPTGTNVNINGYTVFQLVSDLSSVDNLPKPTNWSGYVWKIVAFVGQVVSKTPSTNTYVLNEPATSSTFLPTGIANSYSFRVVTNGANGVHSTPTALTTFKPQTIANVNNPSHLPNLVQFNNDGSFFTNGQNSQEEIMDSVSMFLGTTAGDRTVVPGYGIEDLTFTQIDTSELTHSLSAYEPRAKMTLTVNYDDYGNANLSANIRYNQEDV